MLNKLSAAMLEMADRDHLSKEHPMRVRAWELEDIFIVGELSVERFLGAWARARRVYCEYTGDPII